MVNCRSEETAEQVAARRESDKQRTAERRSKEILAQFEARRARDQERAANRRAGEHAVSLEVEVGNFGVRSVINSRTRKVPWLFL